MPPLPPVPAPALTPPHPMLTPTTMKNSAETTYPSSHHRHLPRSKNSSCSSFDLQQQKQRQQQQQQQQQNKTDTLSTSQCTPPNNDSITKINITCSSPQCKKYSNLIMCTNNDNATSHAQSSTNVINNDAATNTSTATTATTTNNVSSPMMTSLNSLGHSSK